MALERYRPKRELGSWSPFRDLLEEMRRAEDLFAPAWRREEWALTDVPIEVTEEDRFIVKAEIPGINKEDVDIFVSDSVMTIKGEKKTEKEEKKEGYYYSERSYGSFMRSITLPSYVDTKKVEANYEDGVLEISLPKSAEVKPKKIAISVKKK